MDTPRPTLLVNGSYRSSAHAKKWKRHVDTVLAIPPDDLAKIRKVLANYRSRQTRKLGHRNEDPDPYDSSYVFFCLDGRREN
jgi:hypothetical protein